MSRGETKDLLEQLNVRSYKSGDQEVVNRLYTNGLLAGQIASNDTGADIENIQEAYFNESANHFWVADLGGCVLGMIGVARDHEHTAEIRRLRVDKQWQHTSIGASLIETALLHCKRHGYLKVVLDTRFDPDLVVDLFDRLGFQHTRTKPQNNKEVLEFYLDLYRQAKSPEQG